MVRWLTILGVLGWLPLHAGTDSVVTFHEIHYHPDKTQETEWIELYNQMSIRVDLSGWRLAGGVDFTFPEGSVLAPKGYLVIHGTGAPLDDALGPFEGQLDNAGETVTLRDRNDRVMDRLRYDDDAPWPVGADGSGMTLRKRHGSLATAEPSSWEASQFPGGSPGSAHRSHLSLPAVVLSEIDPNYTEIVNRGSSTVALTGFRTSVSDPLEAISLAPGAYHVISPEGPLSEGQAIFLYDASGRLLDAGRVGVRPRVRTDEDAWLSTETPTPGETNRVDLQDAIVISEILYHYPPTYDQPDTPEDDYAPNDEEWLELFNRSEDAVDLSGWTLDGDIHFRFPQGTVLESEEVLVVTRDIASLQAKHPKVRMLGNFSGRLGNDSDTILLQDPIGNPVDSVRYHDSGRWPQWADGGGSSLELRDPWADNAHPASWRASREEDKAAWVAFSYEGPGSEPLGSNHPDHFQEFLMGLLDSGEVLVTDVVVEDTSGAENVPLLRNGNFRERNLFSGELSNWVALGTHRHSHPVETVRDGETVSAMRIVADGAIEHSYNNVSHRFASDTRIEDDSTYRIAFSAKWCRGNPALNTRLYLNRLARTHPLPLPDRLGSPGEVHWEPMGPTLDLLTLHPLRPPSGEAVTVSISAADPQGVASVHLVYRTPAIDWKVLPMTLEGSHWHAHLPGQSEGQLIQFYVMAEDGDGATACFPEDGPDSRALLRFGEGRHQERSVDAIQLLLWPDDHDFMRRPEHAVSNGRFPGTLIVNDEHYHPNIRVRLRSSPYGRRGNRVGYNVAFGSDDRFRGVHDSIALDRGAVMPNGNANGFLEVKAGAGMNELLINQIAQRAGGIPTTYEDVVFVETPRLNESSLAQLRMARYGSAYLDGQYENGSSGATHKFELIYHPTTTINGRHDGLKGPYTAVRGVDIHDMGESKESYRFHFIPTNNRDHDDFSGIRRLGKALSSRTHEERRATIPQAIDVDQWMRVFAFQSLIGVADTYNNGLEHNLVLYTRPSDGRVLAFPWDLDHGFYYSPDDALLGRGNTNLDSFIRLPENARLFYGHLHDLVQTAFHTDAMDPWITHLCEITESDHQQQLRQYIDTRGRHVLAALKKAVQANFRITTNRGLAFDTDRPWVTLEGTGWIDLRAIRNESTGQMLELTWPGIDTWQTVIPLQPGENVLNLQAIGFRGENLGNFFAPGTDRITITHTGEIAPPSPNHLIISEIHYHPSDAQGSGEFLELQNIGSHPIDLAGIRFTRGITWGQPVDTSLILAPGHVFLLAHDASVFPHAHGYFPDSRLDNGGETLRLEDRSGTLITEVAYGDAMPWPSTPDGTGHSLVRRSGDGRSPYHWRASITEGGTPGETTPSLSFALPQVLLQMNTDGHLTLQYPTLADAFDWHLEASNNLTAWVPMGDSLPLLDRVAADEVTTLTWNPTPQFPYYRLRFTTETLASP